jgi:sulfopyruvate decarboxylase TPP-binding subunit
LSNAVVEKALAAARGLERAGPDFVAYAPSHYIAPTIHYFRTRSSHAGAPRAFAVAREEEAIGITGAINLAGARS